MGDMKAPILEDTVGAIMTKKPITIDFDAPIKKVLQTMVNRDIGSLIVLKNAKPVGIITERDVTRISLRSTISQNIHEDLAGRLMSSPLITARPETPIWQVFEAMISKKIRRLPIVEQGRLVGIVTERDLVKWALRVFYAPNIPDRIKKFLD